MNILKVLTPKRIIGNVGEAAAARYLRKNGYKVLKTNYVALGKEIDIIAEDRLNTVFVEVKTRSADSDKTKEPRPACAVTPEKQRGIIQAARYYITRRKKEKRVRFDVIEVIVSPLDKRKVIDIRHLENAFNHDTAKRRKQ